MSARTRREKARALKRQVETIPVKKTFRVYAEGTSTEPEYIDAIRRAPKVAESVSIAIRIERAGASPMTLVESACADKRRSSVEIDFYWCVFDVESPRPHPYMDRALQMAHDNGVHLAVSNPCFELWLVLHLQDQTAYLTTSEAVSLRARLDGSDGKHLDPALYLPLREEAAKRAARLRAKHEQDATHFPHNNPSSSFDIFVADVLSEAEAASPQSGEFSA